MEEEEKNLELRSEEIKEIMGTPPSWIIRYGSMLSAGVVALMILLAWVVKYSDIRRAPVVLTTSVPPAEVVAVSDGQIEYLFPVEGEKVTKDELLAVINSTGNFEQIIMLEEDLGELEGADQETILEYNPNENFYDLGELQPHFSKLVEYYETYNRDQNTNYNQRSVRNLIASKAKIRSSIRLERENLEYLQIELNAAVRNVDRMKKLFVSRDVAERDLEIANDKMTTVRSKIGSTKSTIQEKNLELDRINGQVIALQQNKEEVTSFNYVRFSEEVNRVKSAIQDWKLKYLLKSPIDGKVSFPINRKKNQHINRGDLLLNIIPEEGGDWIGEVKLPVAGSGKVKEGQRVVLKFDNYPYYEYGIVEGLVKEKSLMSRENAYNVKVELVDGLNTSYGEELHFNQGMQGSAEIITEKKRYLNWMFDKLLSRMRTE